MLQERQQFEQAIATSTPIMIHVANGMSRSSVASAG